MAFFSPPPLCLLSRTSGNCGENNDCLPALLVLVSLDQRGCRAAFHRPTPFTLPLARVSLTSDLCWVFTCLVTGSTLRSSGHPPPSLRKTRLQSPPCRIFGFWCDALSRFPPTLNHPCCASEGFAFPDSLFAGSVTKWLASRANPPLNCLYLSSALWYSEWVGWNVCRPDPDPLSSCVFLINFPPTPNSSYLSIIIYFMWLFWMLPFIHRLTCVTRTGPITK